MKIDWRAIINAIFHPTDYVKRKCLIDGLPMKLEGAIYRCPNGHVYDPSLHGRSDELIDQTRGPFRGDL